MKVNVFMDLTMSQAFHILLKLGVELDDVPPKFEVDNGEIVCEPYKEEGWKNERME